jgi:hypothetical protein
MSATVILNPSALAALLRGPQGPVYKDLIKKATEVQRLAKIQVGKRTHNLEHTIVKRVRPKGGGFVVEVGSTMPYAFYHHEGFAPFEAPNGMYFVATQGANAGHLIRINRHPGWKGNHYLSDPLRAVMARG